MKTIDDFNSKYSIAKYMLYENSHWRIALRQEQKTPFSLILCVKTNIFDLGEMTKDQNEDLLDCYRFLKKLLILDLKAYRINYLCLMMVDDILHYHVFPRFKENVVIDDLELTDKYFPLPVDLVDGYDMIGQDISILHAYLRSLIQNRVS